MTTSPGSSADGLTIDALAGEFALPVSTVRMYQNKRILPPPVKRGRVGYYGDQHRERLTLIAALQKRGFSLAAIKETLDSRDAGASVRELIDAGAAFPDLDRPKSVTLSSAELNRRFGASTLTAAHLRRAAELGLIEIRGKRVTAMRVFLDAGAALAERGESVDVILDEFAAMKTNVSDIVERFVALFDRSLWQPFVDAGKPAAELSGLADEANDLIALAKQIVVATLDTELTAIAADRLSELDQA